MPPQSEQGGRATWGGVDQKNLFPEKANLPRTQKASTRASKKGVYELTKGGASHDQVRQGKKARLALPEVSTQQGDGKKHQGAGCQNALRKKTKPQMSPIRPL